MKDTSEWNTYAKLVMKSLEDHDAILKKHEERFAQMESAITSLRIEMVKANYKGSFMGALTAVLLAAIPALIAWWFSK